MQVGIFSVSDITKSPVTGKTPNENERIQALLKYANKAEEVGLDVFGVGEHHNPPFFSSSPAVILAAVAGQTKKINLTTATTLITTNDPVRLAEEYALLQHLSAGRNDITLGKGNTGPVYPWFGCDINKGSQLAIENYDLLHKLWTENVVNWDGEYRTPMQSFTSTPRPLDGVPPFVWHGTIRSAQTAEQAAYYGDGLFMNNIFWPQRHTETMISLFRERWEHYGKGSKETAIVGIGAHAFIADTQKEAIKEFRPYFDKAPVYGRGPSLEQFMKSTPLAVGTVDQVVDKYTKIIADYGFPQRILFLVDHAGLEEELVLEQITQLGTEVAPRLRQYWFANKPSNVPNPPTHSSLVAKRDHVLKELKQSPWNYEYPFETGENWTRLSSQ